MTKLIENNVAITENDDGLLIANSQYIPQSFLDRLKDLRFESKNRREGEYMLAAEIPMAVYDNWLARGIPAWDLSVRQTIALLKQEGLDAFITTDKQV